MTITAVFDHRGRVKKNELGPIEFRISHARRIYYIGTGIRVRESQFKFGTIVNHDQSDELNDRLRILLTRLEQEVNKILQSGQAIDVASIKRNISTEFVDRRKNNSNDLLEWIDEQIPLLKLKEGTRKHYRTLLIALYDCGCLTSFRSLSPEAIYQFDAYLHTRKKRLTEAEVHAGKEAEYISDSGVYNYHNRLKALLNRAVLFGIIDSNPYDRLRGKFKRGERENVEYLTEDEMTAFENLHPTPGSQLADADGCLLHHGCQAICHNRL